MDIDVIGRACMAPGADSPQELFRLLRENSCSVSSIPAERWDLARYWHPLSGIPGKTYSFAAGVLDNIYDFDPGVFGLSKREALQMDPQQRILLKLVWRALEDANIPIASLRNERVGVYAAASSLDSGNLSVEDPASGSPYFMTGNTLSVVANRISHIFALSGPSITIDTACSSSLVALDQAVRALSRDDIDTAIVGGINVLAHPLSFVGFSQARMLSPEGLCRAYDNDGQGYVRAEGGGVVILRRSDRAAREKDRAYAKIIATGVNSAGRTNGISLPSREAQAALLRSIYSDGKIDPNRLAFVEGHGTGTRVGDPAEVWAIGTVLGAGRRAPVPIGSVKSNIGHAEPASGMFGLLKAMLALENNLLPASLHVNKANEDIDFEGLNVRINTSQVELLRGSEARLAGINSFGFGGTNAHVVISDPDPRPTVPRSTTTDNGCFFMASAHTASALETLLADYKARLKSVAPRDARDARDLIGAAGANRTPLQHRFAALGNRPEDVVQAIEDHLAGYGNGAGERGESPSPDVKIAFVFSGNGSQWAGMGVNAYRENRYFRQCFKSFSALFEVYLGESLVDIMTAPDLAARLVDTKIAQPMLFAVQAALSDSLVGMGIRPSAVFGHSVGEIAAAYAARMLTAVDAVAIVAKRSRCQDMLAGEGTMAAVVLGADAAREFARVRGLDEICVAAVNSPTSVTISGPVAQVQAFRDAARKAHVTAKILDINYPFHHPIIDRARDAFLDDLPEISPHEGSVAFLSTVTGQSIDGRALDAQYWWRNVREPVLFKDATEAALNAGCNLFLEISPRPILSNYLIEIAKNVSSIAAVVPTLLSGGDRIGLDEVHRTFARTMAHGAVVERSQNLLRRNAAINLPPLPFEEEALSAKPTSDRVDLFGRDSASSYTLLGWRTDPNGTVWKNHIDANLFPDLAEHVVDGKAILPGSGFIEMAINAARVFHGTDDIEVTNLEIMRPLELRDNRISEMSTVLSPETGTIEIRSREHLSHDDWVVHAVARVRRPIGALPADRHAEIDRQQKSVLTSARVYETAHQFGLDYGPSFQLLSKATAFGTTRIEVDLKPAAAPAHPYLSYTLNPMSVDAVFHGLVALFDRFAGAHGGAPYIPVRFGSVRMSAASQAVARAVIDVERFSVNSIKARFRFLGEDGEVIATFEDCRFRRTFLRQHNTLDTASFHYEAVLSPLAAVSSARIAGPASLSLFDKASQDGVNGSTLLLEAAIYRACHEIALKLAPLDGRIRRDRLPEDFRFRCFLTNCLYILKDAGIAEEADGIWHVPTAFTLPPVEDILRELGADAPDRIVEAVLINNVHREALERLGLSLAGDASSSTASEATLDHMAVHSALGRRRKAAVLHAVAQALQQTKSGRPITILELGAVSPAFSADIAGLAAAYGASLVVLEPRDNLRRTLEIAFEGNAHAIVADWDARDAIPVADLVVSASDHLYALLQDDGAARDALKSAGANGARIAVAERSPSVFGDFVNGLSEEWFASSPSADFPVGRLATRTRWEEILGILGFTEINVQESELPEGGLLLVEGQADAAVFNARAHIKSDGLPTLVMASRTDAVPVIPGIVPVPLVCDGDTDVARLATGLEALENIPTRAVFMASSGAGDVSAVLQHRVALIGDFAEAVRLRLDGRSPSGVERPRLVIVAPGGAPVARAGVDAVNTGLWTFARVLQNEYDFLDVHLLDADPAVPATGRVVADLLQTGQDNREWLVDARTGALSEVRVVPGPFAREQAMTTAFDAATVHQKAQGRVDSIVWEKTGRLEPRPGEVLVAVAAAGLNFRDVMWAMGLLPEEALEDGFAGATIGMELSGTVLSVGAGVDDLVAGDRVMGIAPAAFSTHVRVAREGVTKVPASVDLVAAATVPVAFLTAYYAMVQLGHIQAGETILIHGAAGGVGLAALQVAKLKGARVIATAGTVEKRRFLTALGADHVFDSRSLNFVSDVLAVTGGEGVDLVLNSLFSEAMERSFELVRPFGRFLELGKRDYYSDRKIGLRPFRRNISYFGIDADQLLVRQPKLTEKIFREVGELFAEGKFSALPYRAFEHGEISSAFRLMQNAGHIGKIVICPPVAGEDQVFMAEPASLKLSGTGVFVVAGGIGGFGLAAADWLVARGARQIALTTRRGEPDEETAQLRKVWEKKGVSVSLHACDITDEKAVGSLLAQLRKDGPIQGVVHAAMVLDDALISNLNRERNRPVIDVKVKGADILDRLTRKDPVELFLLFSSATTMIGNPGQSNYVAANGYLEGLARARRLEGLPALAVGYGAIADKGFLTRNADVSDILSKRIGKTALKAREALDLTERYLMSAPADAGSAAVMISPMDWAAAGSLAISRTALFSAVPRKNEQHQSGDDGGQIDLVALVSGKSEDEAHILLFGLLAGEIAAILRVAEETVTEDKVLKDIGLDSLMTMELGMGFQQKTGFDIPLSSVTEGTTIGDVVRKLHDKIRDRGQGSADHGTSGGDDLVGSLASRHSITPIKAVK